MQLMFVGFFSYLFGSLYNIAVYSHQERVNIPWKHGAKCGAAVVMITVAYSYAIKFTNFPVVMMMRSCGLLSVVVVGVMFTGVSDTALKLGRRKIIVALVVTLGMIIFKVYDPNQKEDGHQTELIGILLMVVSLIGEGFLPDFQAVIKQDYQPNSMVLLAFVNKWTTIISILYSLVMGHFLEIVEFIRHHQAILVDNLAIGVLCFLGQVFIYRLVRQFKQHIVPFIITTRKIFTVALSIFYFGHKFNPQQALGVGIVLAASLYEFIGELTTDLTKAQPS